MTMDSARCPIDGKADGIELLSAVVVQEKRLALMDHDSPASHIVRYIQPPMQASPGVMARVVHIIRTHWLGIAIILAVGAAVWISAAMWRTARYSSLDMALVVIGTILVLAWFIYSRTGRQNYAAGFDRWQGQRRVWSRLMYCARHDVVFDPETGVSFDPKDTADYVRRSGG
jgi:hypothetical protein